jgi:hypothetical protein
MRSSNEALAGPGWMPDDLRAGAAFEATLGYREIRVTAGFRVELVKG